MCEPSPSFLPLLDSGAKSFIKRSRIPSSIASSLFSLLMMIGRAPNVSGLSRVHRLIERFLSSSRNLARQLRWFPVDFARATDSNSNFRIADHA